MIAALLALAICCLGSWALGYLHGVESARGASPRQGSASQQLDSRAARATPLVDRRPPRAERTIAGSGDGELN